MEWFYLIAFIPILIGAFLQASSKNVLWTEWLLGTAAALILAAICHFAAFTLQTGDTETLSGQIISSTHHPRWVEEYEETVTETYTDPEGNTKTKTKTVKRTRTHPEFWDCEADFGSEGIRTLNSTQADHQEISARFGGTKATRDSRPGRISGDPNIYVAHIPAKLQQEIPFPVTTTQAWTNRLKNSQTLLKFAKVPKGTPVLDYPTNHFRHSQRLLGSAASWIPMDQWDRLNSRCGPLHKANLIWIGFPPGTPSQMSHWQEAHWKGGKKNDLVIVTSGGSPTSPPEWTRVFGWSQSTETKKALEDLVQNNPPPKVPQKIEETLANTHYQIRDWKALSYIRIHPPTWMLITYIILLFLTQGGLYLHFHRTREW